MICLVIGATVLWGVVPLAEMKYLDGVSIVTVAALFTGILLVIAPVVYVMCRQTLHIELPTLLTHNRHVVLYGTIGLALSLLATRMYLQGMKLCGERNTQAVVAITCAYPVVTAILLWIVHDHRLNLRVCCGLATIVAGCVLLAYPSK